MAILTELKYIILQKCKLSAKRIQNCTKKSTFKLGESFFFGSVYITVPKMTLNDNYYTLTFPVSQFVACLKKSKYCNLIKINRF